MSDRDTADHLNQAWDDYVQRPPAARASDDSVDLAIRAIHAADRALQPDPAFRERLKRQLERQSQERAGHEAVSQNGQPTLPVLPAHSGRGAWPIELLTIATVLALVVVAVFWAIEFRPTDDDPSATFELAATSPQEPAATPALTPAPTSTKAPTATEAPSPTATREPAATVASSPTATAPTATTIAVACADISGSFDALLAPVANPALVPDTTAAIPADPAAIADLDRAFEALLDCLGNTPPEQRRLDIVTALERSGMQPLAAFTVSQDIDHMIDGEAVLSDHRRIDEATAIAVVSIAGTARYDVFFASGPEDGQWIVTALAAIPVATGGSEPAGTEVDPVIDPGGESGTDASGDGDSSGQGNDDEEDSGSGDDTGEDDNSGSGSDGSGDDGGDDSGSGGDDGSDDDGEDD